MNNEIKHNYLTDPEAPPVRSPESVSDPEASPAPMSPEPEPSPQLRRTSTPEQSSAEVMEEIPIEDIIPDVPVDNATIDYVMASDVFNDPEERDAFGRLIYPSQPDQVNNNSFEEAASSSTKEAPKRKQASVVQW